MRAKQHVFLCLITAESRARFGRKKIFKPSVASAVVCSKEVVLLLLNHCCLLLLPFFRVLCRVLVL